MTSRIKSPYNQLGTIEKVEFEDYLSLPGIQRYPKLFYLLPSYNYGFSVQYDVIQLLGMMTAPPQQPLVQSGQPAHPADQGELVHNLCT